MTLAFYTCIVSPHQLPLAYEIVRNHPGIDFRYVYTQGLPPDATKRGWEWQTDEPWMMDARKDQCAARKALEDADVVYSTERDLGLFAKRIQAGRKTFYMSERWFKPIRGLPGWIRLFHPRYFKLACGMAHLLANSKKLVYLPIGNHAAKDMNLLLRLFGCKSLAKFVPWAYFVSQGGRQSHDVHNPLRVLWVGRMLGLKRVDTIIRAVGLISKKDPRKISLTLVGQGPERARLQKLAQGLPVTFMDGVPIDRVRELMRDNDVYVLSSNGYEGWGAVALEAAEEGMRILGTFEAGSTSTILPTEFLFHAGDYKRLAELLSHPIPVVKNEKWTPEYGAKFLVEEGMKNDRSL